MTITFSLRVKHPVLLINHNKCKAKKKKKKNYDGIYARSGFLHLTSYFNQYYTKYFFFFTSNKNAVELQQVEHL